MGFGSPFVNFVDVHYGNVILKLGIYAPFRLTKNYLVKLCQRYSPFLTLFCSFPSCRNFLVTGSGPKKHLEHDIFVCLSILRIAECLAPGHFEGLFSAQDLCILVSSPGLSLIGWLTMIGLSF